MMNKKISYSAIVLTDSERAKLLGRWGDRIPDGWEKLAHHCTINMGELPADLKDNIGLPVTITTTGFFINDKVCAVGVVVPPELSPFMKNAHPHITLAVNRGAGGKPVMSNELIQTSLDAEKDSGTIGTYSPSPFKVIGIVQEIPHK